MRLTLLTALAILGVSWRAPTASMPIDIYADQTNPKPRLCHGDGKSGGTRGTATTATAPSAQGTIAQVAWIGGTWIGSSGNITVEERWTAAASGSMLGIGRTLRNGAMTSFEFLCVTERDGGLVYTAMPNGRTPATDFIATSVTADSVTFENAAHDFPKRIRYSRRADGSLETVVSGDANQPTESFVLTREKAASLR